jgi:immune inhibitor A
MCSRRFKPRAVFSFYLGLFLLGAAAASCGGGGGGGGSSDNEPPPPDHTVTAVAYANIYTGSRRTLFVLDGSQSSDSSGQALNYQWSQGLGPSVVLSPSAASAVASFYPALDYAGDYVFVLTVANGSVSGSDSVRLTVTNQAPTALAGATPSAGTRQTVFTLSASQSQDPDNDPLLYQWDQVAGPSVLLQPSSTAASVSFLPEPGYTGDYLFHLTVDDGLAVSGDSVRVRVDNSGPVAQVVQGIFGYPKQKIVLDGSASQDPDGDPLQFNWTQLSGATVALDLSVPSRPSFTADAYGNYVFQLTVSDGLLSSSAQTTIHVIAPEFHVAPAKGQNRVLVLLANFADTSPSFYAQDFQNLLFADTALTMRDYYRTVSYGQFDLVGDVVGWFNLSHPKSYYNNNNKGTEPKDYPHNLWSLVEEAVDLAEAQGVDFSNYDNDGDGWVDSLIVIHQGMDYQRSGDMNELATIQTVFSLGRAQTRYYDGKKIEYFTLCPEQRRPDPVSGAPRIMDISTYVREYAYLMGMKRSTSLYVRGLANPPSNPTGYEIGVGFYDLMAYGVYGGDGTRYWQPVHPAAFHKSLVGWLAPEVITADTTLTLPAVETHPYAAKIMTGPDPREYFLLTNQQRLNYDEKLLSKGLFVWHVDQTSFFQNTDRAYSSDPGLCNYPNHPWSWRHPMLMLEQADGKFQLEDGTNLGDTVDSFRPGQEFSSASVPSSLRYDCYPSGIKVSQVSESDTVVRVRVELNQFQSDFSNPRLLVVDYHFSPPSPGDGDTDPYPEAGETLDLWLKLFNTGTVVNNLSLQFAATSQYLEPILTNATYPDLAPGSSAYNLQPLRLKVKQTNAREVPAVLKLNFTANGGLYRTSKVLNIILGVPSILLVDDDGSAKADQRIMYELYSLDYQWTYWEVAQKGVPPLEEMLKHRVTFWLTGPVVDEPLNSEELSRIEAYLDHGGKLVLSSQYLLLNPTEAAADFARNYLKLDCWSDDNYAAQYIWGTTASPISSAMNSSKLLFINYYTIYPRTVGLTPQADVIPVFKNDRMNTTTVQYAKPGGYGVVYSAVGLEHLSYVNLDLTARLMNGVSYLPGQPVITKLSPSPIAPRAYALALTVEGVNLTESTSFSFPDGGINLLSKTKSGQPHLYPVRAGDV